jgi:hypothetical protein
VGGNQFLPSAVKPLGRKPKGQTNGFNESLLEQIEFYFGFACKIALNLLLLHK